MFWWSVKEGMAGYEEECCGVKRDSVRISRHILGSEEHTVVEEDILVGRLSRECY